MSFKTETFKEIRHKIYSKTNILISGNIDDLFFVPDRLINSELKNSHELSTLHEIIYRHFKKEGYEQILLIDQYGNSKQVGLGEDGAPEESLIPFDVFLEAYKTAKKEKKKIALVINFPESIFREKAQDPYTSGGGDFSKQIVDLINTNFDNGIDYIEDDRKIVMITKQPDTLYNRLINDNIELATINIPKPNFETRKKIIRKFGAEFNIKNGERRGLVDKNSKDFRDAVSLTDDFSSKEILQMIKLSKSFQIPLDTFKELYNTFTIAKTSSPWEKLDFSSKKEILKQLTNKVKGQEKAAEHVAKTITKAITGLSGIQHNASRSKPKGIAFFVGPTGVGKTEMAKAITNLVFHDETNLLRFDMSEYKQDNSDQRLIGSPPGYVGYAAGGQLTNAVKEKPFSVILFDEIEKANPKIFDIFLQILEDGRLTSSKGEVVDFSETFIIFTSNIGASEDKGDKQPNYLEEVKKYFREELGRPEIFGRINESNVITFNRIDPKIAKEIVVFKLDNVFKYIMKNKNIELVMDEKTKNNLIDLIIGKFDKNYGGRDVVNKIEDILINPLAEYIFYNKLNNLDDPITITLNLDKETGEIIYKK